ncbi:HMA2 domain-containing protein [Nostoc sp. UHCC 0302]|uniref:HMA2 domain-containing protein n=1 Tax=Nostoc sp. UHCC 0302 TaxID=3134896 RepID=UPI00311CC272
MEGSTSYPVAKSSRTPTQAVRVVYSITYATPGKVAFCVPRISEDPEYQQRLLTLLEKERWVITQQINPIIGSVLITYQLGVMADVEMRWHLISLLQTASDEEVIEQIDTESVVYGSEPELVADAKKTQEALNFESEVLTHHEKTQKVVNSEPELVTQPKTTEKSAQVIYSVAHAIPGRVRFHVPQIASDPNYVERLEALLQADPAVTSERVNRDAASIVITYKTGMLQDSKKLMQSVLEVAVSHLANLIQSANDVRAGISRVNATSSI